MFPLAANISGNTSTLAPVFGKSILFAMQQGLKSNTKMPIRTSKSSFQGSTEIIPPLSGQENGRINDHISDLEQAVLNCLREDPGMTNAELIVKTGKSQRTITRALASLKGKGLITRIGSNKTGHWQVK